MPELPEVQTVVNDLIGEGLIGRCIESAEVLWPKTIATSSPSVFKRRISGCIIKGIERRAKLIVFNLGGNRALAVHLRMTGRFQLVRNGSARTAHVHVVLNLEDGRTLQFNDTRKFGRFYLTDDIRALLASYGPEPLDRAFTTAVFARRLGTKKRQIKPLLLDQHFLAGLGNIYVDEALWAARIHPLRRSDSLTSDEVAALYRAIRKVLKQGITHAGTTLGQGEGNFYSLGGTRGNNANHLKVFRRVSQPCQRCRTPISRIIVGQRSSHVCQHCQRWPSGAKADRGD